MKFSYESQPFLEVNEQQIGAPEVQRKRFLERFHTLPTIARSLLCIIGALSYTLLTVTLTLTMCNRSIHPNNALENPSIRYHTNKTITAGMSPFAGGPEEKIDSAWHSLMSSISIRVSQKELNRNGNHQESVSLPDGGGNLVWLGVFHQLHCLKMIRQMNYRDHYFPNQTEHDARDMEVHINHCIENLRQSVMCNPDTSFTTFVWTHSDPKPVLDVRRFERKCADWDYFMDGLRSRVVDYEEVDELVNPLLNETKKY